MLIIIVALKLNIMISNEFFLNIILFVGGGFVGLLNNILTTKGGFSKKWQSLIYIIATIAIILGIIGIFLGYLTYSIAAIIIGLIDFFGSYFLLNKIDSTCKTKDLVPKVIKFTETAHKDEIRLWAGDLDFFGNDITEMENNSQYIQLKNKNFDKICILCKRPKINDTKTIRRYGKMLTDFNDVVEFKFYNDSSPDLHIRGRIKRKLCPDVFVSLIYEKIDTNKYKTIEEDVTKSDSSEVYLKIWDLSWRKAKVITINEINEYKASTK